MSEEEANAPAAPAPEGDKPSDGPASGGDGTAQGTRDTFDQLVAEFEEANPPSENKANGSAKPKTPDDLREEYNARREIGVIQNWAAEVDAERLQQVEDSETAAVIERGNEMVANFPVPENFAERFLRSEYMINPALQEAWNNRHDSPEAQRACEREVDKALSRLHDAARTTPDPELTADRMAVAFAVRNASKRVPEGKPPDYSKMSDKEFSEVIESLPD